MVIASSIVEAYCNISLVKIETGVFAIKGIFDFPAFIVTVNPCSFIPETTPSIPPQVTDIYLCPFVGFIKAIIFSLENSSPTKKSKFLPITKLPSYVFSPQAAKELQPTKAKSCKA